MKRKKSIFLCFNVIISTLLLFSYCSDGGSDSNFFFESAKDVGPRFEEAASKSTGMYRATTTWESGDSIYEMYMKLRDFDPSIHSGVIDSSNVYKLIYDAGGLYNEAKENGESITSQIIFPAFDLGQSVVYDYAKNYNEGTSYYYGLAYREAGGLFYALLCSKVFEESGPQTTPSVMQCTYNESTGDLEIYMAYLVNYPSGEVYSVRTELIGNDQTHSFDLRIISYNSSPSSQANWRSWAGKGVSQGAGNYFLLKMNSNFDNTDRYYVFPAGSTDDDLKAMDSDGYAYADLPSTVDSYKEDVQAKTFFTVAEVPTALTDFPNVNHIDLSF